MNRTALDISISLPGDWLVVQPERLDETEADALVGRRLDAVPALAPYRDDLVAGVGRTMARAGEEGVVFTALLAGMGRDRTPLTANLAIATAPTPSPPAEAAPQTGEPAGSPLAWIEATLAESAPEADTSERDVTTLLLPGGPALRIARLVDLPLADNGPLLRVLGVQYFFLVPDADQAMVLSFSSPSLGAIDHLQALFHEIAKTFSMG